MSPTLIVYPNVEEGVFMKVSLLNSYSDDEFRKIVLSSHSHAEALRTIGYHTNSGNIQKAYLQRIKDLNIEIPYTYQKKKANKLKPEDVFVKNATCSNTSLRRAYLKENTNYICSICGQGPIWHGKPLTLILDHINGIHSDNRLENLRWVCPNCNIQLDTTARNKTVEKSHPKPIKRCKDCGKQIDLKSTRCNQCEQNKRIIKVIQGLREKVSREDLKSLIRNKSFLAIGKMFNVSDNAVRKWCKTYGLPYKSREISHYSDEEWDKI